MNNIQATQRNMAVFVERFEMLTGFKPMRWQQRLYDESFVKGALPSAVSVPTGLGKTAIMAVWMIALAQQIESKQVNLPRRLVYVVDRRAVVDQATHFAEYLRSSLQKNEAEKLRDALGLGVAETIPISTLRGQFVDNRDWLADPSRPAIIVGTVDMIGSRLLFEGYSVSRKMRPYHAGLLGADALVLLDEAHLVPPFEALLAEISENAKRYGAKDDALNTLVPKLHLLPLSATGRRQTATPFVLQESDVLNPGDKTVIDAVVHERLNARKHLVLQELEDKDLAKPLATKAWTLAQDGENDTKPVRVIVYCHSRDVAKSVSDALVKMAGKTPIKDNIELFVGARRVRERSEAEKRLQALGFLANDGAQRTQPSFLIATSAGEVGVDLDADHMACDLVAWERMVQRFGRVNRRGGKDEDGKDRQAEIVVLIEPEPEPKKAAKEALEKKDKGESLNDKEQKAIEAYEKKVVEFRNLQGRVQAPFGQALPQQADGSFDVSPEALRQLNERAAKDETLSKLIADASTPAPLRPALNRALVDAWSMTSLPEHTGRPQVAPWLRGWVDEKPQTNVAWRKYLPVCMDIKNDGKLTKKDIKEIEDFFEAAPLHASETLETESWRVFEWLKKRAAKLSKISDDEKTLKAGDVVAMLLKMDGSLVRSLRLEDLLGDTKNKNDKKRLDNIEHDIKGQILVMDARFGGLHAGLLNTDSGDAQPTTDNDGVWLQPIDGKPVIRFRVLERNEESDEATENDWRENLRFDLKLSADDEATRWLSVQKWRDTANTENDRAEGRPQALVEHQDWAAKRAETLGKRLGLPASYTQMLTLAARLHDEGKRAQNWQTAFKAQRDAKDFNIEGPLAKTRGPINQQLLGGYRHEFGSLPYAEDDAEFQKLPQDMQDLVLHLIAAHHGYARPLIATKGCEDAPPSVLEERAQEVALRFARLQKRWGPWGLAWWEALLRAADVQASRANNERED